MSESDERRSALQPDASPDQRCRHEAGARLVPGDRPWSDRRLLLSFVLSDLQVDIAPMGVNESRSVEASNDISGDLSLRIDLQRLYDGYVYHQKNNEEGVPWR